MDLSLLIYFTAVADEMSFSAAADNLYLSQSSLSKHIKRLEDALGLQLFFRDSHTTKLTPAGAALLPYARNIVHELTAVQSQLQRWGNRSFLRLASFSLSSIYHLDKLIADFIQCSGINVSLIEHSSDHLSAMLDGDLIDAYFSFEYGAVFRKKYACFPMGEETLVYATAEPDPRRQGDSVRLSELEDVPMITIAEKDEPFVTRYVEQYAPAFARRIEPCNTWLSSIKSVLKKEGCGALIPCAVAQYCKLSYVPIADLPPFALVLVTKPDRKGAPSLEALKQYLNEK